MRILNVIEGYSEEGKGTLASLGHVDYRVCTQKELEERVREYDALLVRIGLDVNKAVIDAGKDLKVIATATTGLNHIDVPYAKERGIEILSLKDEVSFLDTVTSTAELAFGLLIALMRQIPASFDSVREGRLDLEGFRGSSLYGKTLGIVGMGRLGKIIAEGAAGWRMRVIFHDPAVAQERFPHFRKVSLDELLRESDAISLHLHLSEKTEKMFGRDAFEKMKDTAFLVNTSRGEIVEEEALLSVLEKKEIGGYATDVLTNELELVKKGLAGHPLVEYAKKSRNCIIVPHTGGFTDDSRIATDVFIAKKLIQYLESHG